MKNFQKKAFTLVELIVVITILAILWTIGFISLQNYTTYARDSVRISDLNTIRAALEYTSIATWQYSYPDNPDNITFSWTTVWKQWTFWTESRWITQKISKIPTDPLTGNEYTFSVTESKQEFELWAILESGDSLSSDFWTWQNTVLENTYAAWEGSLAYVIWNYNWKLIKTQANGRDYVLAVPSIINSEIWDAELLDILTRKKLVYNGYSNIPSSYWIENTTPIEQLDFVDEDNFIVFEWTIWDLWDSETDRLELISNLQTAYSWSVIANNSWLADIIWIELDTTNPTNENKLLAEVIVKNVVNVNVDEESSTVNTWNVGSTDWWSEIVATDFISTWKTDNSWISNSNQIKLPLHSSGTYNFTVDWWDDSSEVITSYDQAEITHTYATPWTYKITISWTIEGFTFSIWNALYDDRNDGDKLLDISQWWNLKLANTGVQFWNAENFVVTAEDNLDTSNLTYMQYMFYRATSFNWGISWWNTSSVINMERMFYNANSFNADIGGWNTSNVADMSYMFYNANSFNADIGAWNTSNVADMSYMFYNANSFNKDIWDWDIWNVTNLYGTFAYATWFNQDIWNWDTSNVVTMRSLFNNAKLFNQDIWSWNISNLVIMHRMFDDAESFNQNIWWWNTSAVTDMYWVFDNAKLFNWNISWWDTSKVTTMQRMFNNADSFNQNIWNWQTNNVDDMSYMFNSADSFNQNIWNWQTNNVDNMSYMFSHTSSFNWNISNFDTINVEDMSNMFAWASEFNQNIWNWNTRSVTNMWWMFHWAVLFNQDIWWWDVSQSTYMYRMFQVAYAFNHDISWWITNNTTSCYDIYDYAVISESNKATFANCTP